MKIFIFFIPLVICFDKYYIVDMKDLLVCGNKLTQFTYVNWYEAEDGVFMSISLRRISAEACPTIYYCQYEYNMNEHISFQTADLFVVNYLVAKENMHQFHETTQKIKDKISNNNFYLLIFY